MVTAIVFVINNFQDHGAGLPGAGAVFNGAVSTGALIQVGLYLAGVPGVAAWLTVSAAADRQCRAHG